MLPTKENNNNSNSTKASNQSATPLNSTKANKSINALDIVNEDNSEKKNFQDRSITQNIPTSSKGNLKDDESHDKSSSHSTVNDNGNSCVANQFCPVNVIPMKLDFLPSDNGDDSNSSNKPYIIDLDNDEDVMSKHCRAN